MSHEYLYTCEICDHRRRVKLVNVEESLGGVAYKIKVLEKFLKFQKYF